MDPTQTTSRRRRNPRVLATLLALATAIALMVAGTTTAQAKPRDDALTAAARAATPSALSGPVTGTLQDGSGAVDGTFNVQKFAKRNGKLVAIGKFTGTVTDADGKIRSGSKKIALPVATEPGTGAQSLAPGAPVTAAAVSCQILNLVLGPLDLNLLGLKVHLDTVHLNITAVGGPGNLLGNLLCALAGLLDGSTGLNGILNGIISLLNRLLAVLD